MKVEVSLLDGSITAFDVDPKSTGEDLLVVVAESLQLHEKDYFGFLYLDRRDKMWTWLHSDRKLQKQISTSGPPEECRCLFQVQKIEETFSG